MTVEQKFVSDLSNEVITPANLVIVTIERGREVLVSHVSEEELASMMEECEDFQNLVLRDD